MEPIRENNLNALMHISEYDAQCTARSPSRTNLELVWFQRQNHTGLRLLSYPNTQTTVLDLQNSKETANEKNARTHSRAQQQNIERWLEMHGPNQTQHKATRPICSRNPPLAPSIPKHHQSSHTKR